MQLQISMSILKEIISNYLTTVGELHECQFQKNQVFFHAV